MTLSNKSSYNKRVIQRRHVGQKGDKLAYKNNKTFQSAMEVEQEE